MPHKPSVNKHLMMCSIKGSKVSRPFIYVHMCAPRKSRKYLESTFYPIHWYLVIYFLFFKYVLAGIFLTLNDGYWSYNAVYLIEYIFISSLKFLLNQNMFMICSYKTTCYDVLRYYLTFCTIQMRQANHIQLINVQYTKWYNHMYVNFLIIFRLS